MRRTLKQKKGRRKTRRQRGGGKYQTPSKPPNTPYSRLESKKRLESKPYYSRPYIGNSTFNPSTILNCDAPPPDIIGKIYPITGHPKLIYKPIAIATNSFTGSGDRRMNINNSEILYSYLLSQLVREGNFPHFPLFFGAKQCDTEWRLLYEKADGDGRDWIRSIKMNIKPWVTEHSHDDSVLKSRYISMILQLGLTVIKTRSLGISLGDIKPENFLFIRMNGATPTNGVYFHYQYTSAGVIHNIYVQCVGDLWLRTDFGYESTSGGIPYHDQILKIVTMFDQDILNSRSADTNHALLASSQKFAHNKQVGSETANMDVSTQQNILAGMQKERNTYSHDNKVYYALLTIRKNNEALFNILLQILMNAANDISLLTSLQQELSKMAGSDTIWKSSVLCDPEFTPRSIMNPKPFNLDSPISPMLFTQTGFDAIKGNAIM